MNKYETELRELSKFVSEFANFEGYLCSKFVLRDQGEDVYHQDLELQRGCTVVFKSREVNG